MPCALKLAVSLSALSTVTWPGGFLKYKIVVINKSLLNPMVYERDIINYCSLHVYRLVFFR
jgi:hypothetical protein